MGQPQLQSSEFQTTYYRTPLQNGSPSVVNMGRTPGQPIDLTDDSPPSSSRKRKAGEFSYQTPSKRPKADVASHNTWSQRSKASATSYPSSRKSNAGGASHHTPSKQSKAKQSHADGDKTPKEKRLRRFRPRAPQSFHDIYARALSQRFFVLNRSRAGTSECPEERIEMTGSTGNIYTISIGEIPRCNCPHAEAGNQCKHILYVSETLIRFIDEIYL